MQVCWHSINLLHRRITKLVTQVHWLKQISWKRADILYVLLCSICHRKINHWRNSCLFLFCHISPKIEYMNIFTSMEKCWNNKWVSCNQSKKDVPTTEAVDWTCKSTQLRGRGKIIWQLDSIYKLRIYEPNSSKCREEFGSVIYWEWNVLEMKVDKWYWYCILLIRHKEERKWVQDKRGVTIMQVVILLTFGIERR